MTRDEIHTLSWFLENVNNTACVIVEDSVDDERDANKVEMDMLRQQFGHLDTFRAEINSKYGKGTL